MKPLFGNIKRYDFMEPIRKLEKYYENKSKSTYYKELLENKDPLLNEDILLYYLKCRKDAKILITINSKNDYKKDIEKTGQFYYRKMVDMSYNAIISLHYQMLYNKAERYEDLIKYLNVKGFVKGKRYKMIAYFYEGSISIEDDEKYIANKDFDELIFYSQIFLNNNSLELLEKQNIRKLYNFKGKNCNKIFDKVMKVYNGLEQIERNNLIITGSFILYLYGIRECNDVDIKYVYLNDTKYGFDNKTDEVDLRNIGAFEDYGILHSSEEDFVPYYDMPINSNYFMYFMNFKVSTLDIQMESKKYRSKHPRAFVDIIYVNMQTGLKYNIPKTEYVNMKFIKTMRFFFKKYYKMDLSIEKIKYLILLYK